MNANEYQRLASRTLLDHNELYISEGEMSLIGRLFKLAGEAGRGAETVKKGVFHQHGLDLEIANLEIECIRPRYEAVYGFTPPTDGNDLAIIGRVLGLIGESSEVCDLVEQTLFQGKELDKDLLVKELGDCLWYIATICQAIDVDMGDVMQQNIGKLKARYPEGFTVERSVNRNE